LRPSQSHGIESSSNVLASSGSFIRFAWDPFTASCSARQWRDSKLQALSAGEVCVEEGEVGSHSMAVQRHWRQALEWGTILFEQARGCDTPRGGPHTVQSDTTRCGDSRVGQRD
jgi:hypothetical protein